MTGIVVVTISFPDRECAQDVARRAVEERLAACMQVMDGMRSIYRWQGAIVQENEVLVLAKTAQDKVEALRDFIVKNHPYKVPEIVWWAVDGASESYARWVEEMTRG